jgi:L-ascorbate metabolism protein UlaG (beta-lactamase superfamily)
VEIIRYTHSCVRLERDGRVLVIDPGIWSEPRALLNADAVLVTHEHYDHVDELRLAGLGVPVYAPAEARLRRIETVGVRPGETFSAAGFTVTAEGGRHAKVVPHQEPCANLGYRIEDALYHPGDSLDPPTAGVRTLLVPMQAAWLTTADAIGFVRTVGPERAVGIHDAQVNERGLDSLTGWLSEECPAFAWTPPGSRIT